MHTVDSGSASQLKRQLPWRRLPATRGWHELALPQRCRAELQRLPGLVRQRTGTAHAGAVLAVFIGEPGTGKTLTAQVIAAELGVPVVEVDTDAAMRQGVAAFATAVWSAVQDAQRERAVLVFDDVGAALRTVPKGDEASGRDGLDLLNRCAAYPGLVVFCSQVELRLPPAQAARIDAVVDFPMPDAETRVAIWRHCLGAAATLSPDAIEFIAQAFRLSGATIESCCAAAAALAATSGGPLTQQHVARALRNHYRGWVLSPTTAEALDALASG